MDQFWDGDAEDKDLPDADLQEELGIEVDLDLGYDYDDQLAHMEEDHGLSPDEAFTALFAYHSVVQSNRGGERRWVLEGTTEMGRLVIVIFTVRETKVRIISGWRVEQ